MSPRNGARHSPGRQSCGVVRGLEHQLCVHNVCWHCPNWSARFLPFALATSNPRLSKLRWCFQPSRLEADTATHCRSRWCSVEQHCTVSLLNRARNQHRAARRPRLGAVRFAYGDSWQIVSNSFVRRCRFTVIALDMSEIGAIVMWMNRGNEVPPSRLLHSGGLRSSPWLLRFFAPRRLSLLDTAKGFAGGCARAVML